MSEMEKDAWIRQARGDVALFCECVLRDEETDEPIRLAPYHLTLIREMVSRRRLVVTARPGLRALRAMLQEIRIMVRPQSDGGAPC